MTKKKSLHKSLLGVKLFGTYILLSGTTQTVFLDESTQFPSFTKYIEESQKINNDDELAMYLLNEGKVAVVPGSAFGMSGHLRLSIALDLKTLEIAMNRIKTTLNNDE